MQTVNMDCVFLRLDTECLVGLKLGQHQMFMHESLVMVQTLNALFAQAKDCNIRSTKYGLAFMRGHYGRSGRVSPFSNRGH